ncbi:PREDICTED: E3 ubiquitin-protein ligase MARCH8 [Ceratosolen solmsi marchali]|uniref:E3 ubiquitin-protein ligase MARCH8 n=1 Tax=Ceratosolen solmsi marchali TaxID=326594 RepID=A0AAJ6YQF4_9HYME|nr:PREDICTED: E3 ubiquitin-protein ligase MARCH8 [Ceratosolen solmsi marchali]
MPLHQINVNPNDWQTSRSISSINASNPNSVEHILEWAPREPVYGPIVTVISDHCHSSVTTLSSSNHDICRICHCEGEVGAPLLAPCYCSGSLRYVHQACLRQWIKASDTSSCELCKFTFIMHTKTKPFSEWEKLEMPEREVRKLWFAVTFYVVAVLCVAWSLYVLVERTVEEARTGFVEWGFWMKIIIVVIGSTGGLVFMYIQCKTYIMLCRRWKTFNRVIFIQNAPEKVVFPTSPTESLREATVSLKDGTASMSELNRNLLSRSIEPPCASRTIKPDSDLISQKHDTQLKLYVFDKFSISEDNL